MYSKVGGGVNTVKTLKFEKSGVHDPPAPVVAPPLTYTGHAQGLSPHVDLRPNHRRNRPMHES